MTGPRTAVVTGAGSGIGACVTERLALEGWEVHAVARTPEHLDRLGAGGNVHPVHADIRSDCDVARLVEHVAARTERLDALVNGAGVLVAGTVGATPVDVWDAAVQTNFLGTLRVTQGLLGLLAHRGGRIVTLSSVAASVSVSPQGPYAASKAALEVAMETLAQDLASCGARVTILQPGIVATAIHERFPQGSETLDADGLRLGLRLASFVRSQLRDHPTTPEQVADRVVQVIDDADPPLRATIGSDAFSLAAGRSRSSDTEWSDWWGNADDTSWRDGFLVRTGMAAP